MKRGEFLRKGILGIGAIAAIPVAVSAISKDTKESSNIKEACDLSVSETRGPFPIKSPADYVRENIVGDREGIALLISLTILDKNNNCKPLSEASVDVWHCDTKGDYSEYGSNRMQPTDYTKAHFLRGRQKTDAYGKVSFISVFPGFYPGRAPHIHVEVLNSNQKSLLVTQIAFPEDICNSVYKEKNYQGTDYVSNSRDNVFSGSLANNMADKVSGNINDGYTLQKSIIVEA